MCRSTMEPWFLGCLVTTGKGFLWVNSPCWNFDHFCVWKSSDPQRSWLFTAALHVGREWSMISMNSNPSNPQQPIHSLRTHQWVYGWVKVVYIKEKDVSIDYMQNGPRPVDSGRNTQHSSRETGSTEHGPRMYHPPHTKTQTIHLKTYCINSFT